jgi:hypothetical protein
MHVLVVLALAAEPSVQLERQDQPGRLELQAPPEQESQVLPEILEQPVVLAILE